MCVCSPHLDVVIWAADVGVVLHVECGVELEADREAQLHLDTIQTV